MTTLEEATVMAKRTKSSPMLPREVIMPIAQFISDEASFFAYIGAMQGTACDQGLFKALWCLWKTTPCSRLWPDLELHPMGDDEWELAIQAIPVYATAIMHARYDFHRLVGRVSPSTNLFIVHDDEPDLARMHEWFDQLARLPVRGLVYTTMEFAHRMPMVISHLLTVWPSLTYLRCLDLTVGDQASLESICKCIAASQITDLRLDGPEAVDGHETDETDDEAPRITLEGKAWTDLVAWLQSTRVVRFELYRLRVICDDDVSMQALNRALAASDGLHTIFWGDCAFHVSAPLVLPPQLQKLCFPQSTFELEGIVGTLTLLPTVPSLTHVSLNRFPLSPSDIDTLTSVLAQSNVSYLILDGSFFDDDDLLLDSIQRFADAFEASASLRGLQLAENNMGFDGVKAILEAVERRPYVTEWVNLRQNNFEGRRPEVEDIVNTRMPPNTTIYV